MITNRTKRMMNIVSEIIPDNLKYPIICEQIWYMLIELNIDYECK